MNCKTKIGIAFVAGALLGLAVFALSAHLLSLTRVQLFVLTRDSSFPNSVQDCKNMYPLLGACYKINSFGQCTDRCSMECDSTISELSGVCP